MVTNHMDLKIWKVGIDMVEEIYKITEFFPKTEIFGLSSQIKRAAVSVPSNIAEGASRQTTKEFIQFLYIALGSLSELETQLIIAKKLNFLTENTEKIFSKIKGLKKMILNMIKSLKSNRK
ncbi:four helix bundle protein [Nautilia sp.]